ncbi:DUF6681 family protein [Pediococcus pentosaceus]|uniref:DUF6681 family protein n=1 Tax=Pediococcus pentosaceus TaxID=1255 RepID=UPI002017B903|nr:DUF6681 family protein [Pediococcus pentosaceus]MCL3858425.1 hypothetical protein [Pediococcus pentosaceus]
MISFLTLASHYMGMINVKSKLKNQVYTIMAFVGNWYLLYIGIRFLQNGRSLRGLLLLAIFLVFLYFSIMNIYYFFTTKKAPFDISPVLEKYVGGAPEEIREKEEFRRAWPKWNAKVIKLAVHQQGCLTNGCYYLHRSNPRANKSEILNKLRC